MPFVCQNCGYVSQEKIDECPDCGGLVEEEIPKINWFGKKEENEKPSGIKKSIKKGKNEA